MDKDRIAGSFKQAAGSVRQMVGKLLGDRKTEAQGIAEKTVGAAQNSAGGIKDTIREIVDKK